MPVINTDPDSLERLSKTITQSVAEIEGTLRKLRFALKSVTWNDAQSQKFDKDFQELTHSLNVFVSQAPEVSAHLKKKAVQLRDYNSR